MSDAPIKPKKQIQLDSKTAAVFEKKKYEVTDRLSAGAFGEVFKARKTDTNVTVAVKVMRIDKMSAVVAEKFLPREFSASTTIKVRASLVA